MVDTLTFTGYALVVVWMIIGRFGGPQVAYYRLRRIAYFIDYMRGPDRRYRRRIHRMDEIKKFSPAQFEYGRGNYLAPESEAATSEHGAPMWFHAWDEARAIPQYMDTKETMIDGVLTTVTEYREKVPPELIKAGFLAKTATEIHDLDAPAESNKLAWYVVPMILLILIGVLATAYYAHDVACALRAKSC